MLISAKLMLITSGLAAALVTLAMNLLIASDSAVVFVVTCEASANHAWLSRCVGP